MITVLQDTTFKQLRDLIYEKSGIFIPDTKKYFLENRLMRRIEENNLDSFEDYLYLIRQESNGNELKRLYDAITTNETFFFREPHQLDVFVNEVLPRVMEQKKTRDIKVWSAACSTGEEPYTISMLLKEGCMDGRVEIIASDISDGALESATRAVYNSYSVRNVPDHYLKRYFVCDGQSYVLDQSVKKTVRFLNINLMDEKRVKSISNMDVIFCRNVLIYFDDKAKQKAVSLLYGCLKTGGFLFVGSAESLHNVTRAFKPVVINKVVVYQKV
ncbi:MAG TPA: protein-glutamate O-methyltransferase CheR [Thermodesulfobacteriota bacterium]|jgi:chemotaxis protein methyltransferase CheR|nr:protein-glutamate O-methyltransferase CheR [Thermodesulfobacteriota bacterium]